MENTHLIVGLGNPGREYVSTRHNAGFMVLDECLRRWNLSWTAEKKFRTRISRTVQKGRTVWLCQPQTFMNCSGEAVAALANFYQVPVQGIIAVVDDADLPFGEVRLRAKGSSGGHHGIESLQKHLGTQEFARQKVGIGRTDAGVREITSHVLGNFRPEEKAVLEKVLARAADQVECWLTDGVEKAMNRYNGRVQ